MPRTSDAKEKILNAAKDLFWQHNYGSISVDEICKNAKVNKGSFYYFYESKADLCVACLDSHWEDSVTRSDPVFSSTKGPLTRIKDYAKLAYEYQSELKTKYGAVLGCPITLTGTELSNKDEKVRSKSKEIFDGYCKYFEAVIEDSNKKKITKIDNVSNTANQIFSFAMGVLYHAKISNDPEVIKKELEPGILKLMGI